MNRRGSGHRELLSTIERMRARRGAPLRKSAGTNAGNECSHYGVGSRDVMGAASAQHPTILINISRSGSARREGNLADNACGGLHRVCPRTRWQFVQL